MEATHPDLVFGEAFRRCAFVQGVVGACESFYRKANSSGPIQQAYKDLTGCLTPSLSDTRWLFAFLCLTHCLKYFDSIKKVALKWNLPFNASKKDLEAALEVVGPLWSGTQALQANGLTLPRLVPFLLSAVQCYARIMDQEPPHPAKSFATTARASILRRFKDYLPAAPIPPLTEVTSEPPQILPFLAAALDPYQAGALGIHHCLGLAIVTLRRYWANWATKKFGNEATLPREVDPQAPQAVYLDSWASDWAPKAAAAAAAAAPTPVSQAYKQFRERTEAYIVTLQNGGLRPSEADLANPEWPKTRVVEFWNLEPILLPSVIPVLLSPSSSAETERTFSMCAIATVGRRGNSGTGLIAERVLLRQYMAFFQRNPEFAS